MSKSSSGGGIIASVLIALVASVGISAGGFGIGYGTGILLGPSDQEKIQQEKTENNQSKQDVQKASCAGPNLTIENGTVTWISETWAQNGGRSIPGYENLVDSPTAPQTPTNQDTTDNLNQEPIATITQDQTPPQAQNPAQSQGTSQNAGNTNKGGNSTASKPSSPQTQTGVKIDPSSQSSPKPQNNGKNVGIQSGESGSWGNDSTTNEITGPLDKKSYWTKGGKSYHFSKTCPSLSKSTNIKEGTLQDALNAGKKDPCNNCAGGS